jgi:hypothetical protein
MDTSSILMQEVAILQYVGSNKNVHWQIHNSIPIKLSMVNSNHQDNTKDIHATSQCQNEARTEN